MAIRTETYELNGRQFTHTWSDDDRYILGGEPYGQYAEANDPTELGRTYVEGDLMPPEDIAAQTEEVLSILMGVSE